MAELRTVRLADVKIPEVRVSSVLTDEQKALLSSTIGEIGVVQDIVVRALPDGSFELVAGKSRLMELLNRGVLESQVKVVAADEKLGLIMNIAENVARGGYEYISVAQAIRKLRALGASLEELERIFPWQRRWIEFLEGLQDLPVDVVEGIRTRKITPSHVQLAAQLPTPYEVHDGLKTAINLGWDTGTFKVFVANRLEQIERAKKEAESQGVEPVIPPAEPEALIQYKQCLCCGYKKPRDQVNVQLICDGCRNLAKYITDQLGPPEDAMDTVYNALKHYLEAPRLQPGQPPRPPEPPSQG